MKDIIPKGFNNADFNLANYTKQPAMTPETVPAYKVLENFKESKIHYAFVLDEYGTLNGMVSMDDIIDALIGDVTEYNQMEYMSVDNATHAFDCANVVGVLSSQKTRLMDFFRATT